MVCTTKYEVFKVFFNLCICFNGALLRADASVFHLSSYCSTGLAEAGNAGQAPEPLRCPALEPEALSPKEEKKDDDEGDKV